MSDEQAQPAYELEMPFVVVKSTGGPHDDKSYVAGFAAGQTDRLLAMVPPEVHKIELPVSVPVADHPQYDLIGMRYGWTMKAEEASMHGVEGQWWFITFLRVTL